MNETNQFLMNTALQAAQELARQNDRFAFFVTLIAGCLTIGSAVVWGAKYLVRQNRELIDALNSAHEKHATELKEIVDKLSIDMKQSTEARVAQTEVFRTTAEIMKDATEELRIHRTIRQSAINTH